MPDDQSPIDRGSKDVALTNISKRRKISKAPPPIQSINPSPPHASRSTPLQLSQPNWDMWQKFDRARLWEAACLAANVEPPRIDNNGVWSVAQLNDFPQAFRDIWEVVNRDAFFSKLPSVNISGRMLHTVDVNGFAYWAEHKGFDIPAPLRERAKAYASANQIINIPYFLEDPTSKGQAESIATQVYRQQKRLPARLYGEGFSEEMRKETTLTKYVRDLDTWHPAQAAMLVCGLQPALDGTDIPSNGAMSLSNSFAMPREDSFHEARRVLTMWRSQESAPERVKPVEFVAWCERKGINTDWLREEVIEYRDSPSPSSNDGKQGSTRHQHTIKKRSNPLTAIINKAKGLAEDQNDAHSVWAALVKLALDDDRPPPLLGYVDSEGVKWDSDGTVKFLKKKNLMDRMGSEKRRSNAK